MMAYKQKGRGGSVSYMKGIGIGVVAAILITMILSTLVTFLIINENIDAYSMGYYAFGIVLIASFIGCVISGKLIMERVAILSGAVALVYLLMIVAIGVLFFDGSVAGVWTRLVAVAISGVVSCAFCIRGKRNGKKRKGTVC